MVRDVDRGGCCCPTCGHEFSWDTCFDLLEGPDGLVTDDQNAGIKCSQCGNIVTICSHVVLTFYVEEVT